MSLPEVTGPGIYPLEMRECPKCSVFGEPNPFCVSCHGTGRVPDKDGAKVEIYHQTSHGPAGWFYAFEEPDDYQGPFPSPAEALAAAQRAHQEGKR